MTDIKVLVPCCDADVVITQREILRGILHRKETENKIMVGCPNCSTALTMAEDMPTDALRFEVWVKENAENPDWIPCLPFLDERIGTEPDGTANIGGRIAYRAGAGGPLLTRYAYMVRLGIDPEKALAKNTSMGFKPFVITGRDQIGK